MSNNHLFQPNLLQGRVALVTGASRGIGQGIALALGAAGATVIGTATTEPGAERIVQTLQAHKISGSGFCLDVCDRDRVGEVLKSIEQDFGAVDTLVNNAGITRDNLSMRMKPAEWDSVIATNLTAVFSLTQACLRNMMKKRFGRIINISSVVGTAGNPGQANYVAAKAGIEGMGKSLAIELASRGITVNAIAPGFIKSDMTAALNEQQQQAILTNIPMGHMGEPDDIARVCVFFASADASYITGQTLHVNGGMLMR